MVLASCCGPIQMHTAADVRIWAIVALFCGLLLFGELLAVAILFRRDSLPVWRRKAVLLLALAGGLVLTLAQQAWSAATTLAAGEPSAQAYAYSSDPTDQAWFARLDAALHTYGMLGGLAIAATVLMVFGGATYVLMTRD